MNTESQKSPVQGTFFEVSQQESRKAETPLGEASPRFRCPEREQVIWRPCSLDALLPSDHKARLVWLIVTQLNLKPLEAQVRAVEGEVGRDATPPQLLMAVWLLATLEGIGSARELSRRCQRDIAYQWICGGVTLNYHTLSDFRTAHPELLDELLTQSVAALIHEGLVTMERVAQDGMKVRASAGSSSFRRRGTLEQCLTAAKQQVEVLRQEVHEAPGKDNRRRQAARERAAEERQERVRKALEQVAEVEAKKKAKERETARASTTDPEARVMKMPGGGFRPAYNAQMSTDTASQIITSVEVTNNGSDQGQLAPMVQQHQERYGQTPQEMLVDGGFVKQQDIVELSPRTKVYAPVMESKSQDRDPHTPRDDDPPAVAEWRQRMATPEAKAIYKERAATAECVNALARNRGLYQIRTRGLRKAKAILLWYALAHNLMRAVALRAAAIEKKS
jgi:transposase